MAASTESTFRWTCPCSRRRATTSATSHRNSAAGSVSAGVLRLIDGRPIPACDIPVQYVHGEVVILAGLGGPDALHPVQSAFLGLTGRHCGYRISGMIVSAAALLRDNPPPTRDGLGGAGSHLCRCGTPVRFVDAVLAAAG